MSSQVGVRRTSLTQKRGPSTVTKKSVPSENGAVSNGTTSKPSSPTGGGERTVKKLRLSKALTIPEGTTVSDACRRMAARRVDAVLLTDANALLSGIVTDKDIASRVIAEGLRPEQTTVSKIMTRNPIFVSADSLAMEALQKMIQGKFRHLPVVENGEVIAILDITKCLYDAISRMEKAAEQGSAIAAAVEGVERQWGANYSAPYAFLETLRERMFKPSLSSIISENTKVAIVSPSDPVYVAAKRMRDFRVNSVIIVVGSKIQGILTSKDILMRVVAQNLSPELTLVEKVMTPNPECATLETTILDALHIMHEGKFLHLPVLDRDESVAACVDVLQITHAAISMVENSSGTVNDMANTMMQKFWDSALALEPADDCDTQSEMSALMASDAGEHGKYNYPSLGLGNSFAFKFEDRKGRVHRLNCAAYEDDVSEIAFLRQPLDVTNKIYWFILVNMCGPEMLPVLEKMMIQEWIGTENLDELVSAVMERIGAAKDNDRPQILYEDDEGDKVLLASADDLVSAVSHARGVGQKVLRLHLDLSDSGHQTTPQLSQTTTQKMGWTYSHTGILAGACVLTGIGLMAYLKRSNQ